MRHTAGAHHDGDDEAATVRRLAQETGRVVWLSVLFVVSYVPQLKAIVRSDASDTTSVSMGMFVLQLLSGVIWTAYGTVEQSLSILVFGSMSTVLRLLIIRSLACGATTTDVTTLVLAGGGSLPRSVWRCVAVGAGRRLVCVVPWAEDDPVVASRNATEACNRLWWAGCRSTTDLTHLADASAVWFTGGSSTRLIRRLHDAPALKAVVRRIVHDGGLVGGTSAGAVALGHRGLRLIPWDVCVHATPRSAEHCIAERTALVISDGMMRTVGRGGVRIRVRDPV